MPNVVTDLFSSGGGGSDVVYAITADLEQEDFTTVSTTASADGVATAPDSWALTVPLGSSSSITGSGDTVTFTPDAAGVYTISATTGTQVVARRVAIGLEYAPGQWAKVLVNLDLPTLGAAAGQDFLAGGAGDYTVGGVTLYCEDSGYDAFALGASGIRFYRNGAGADASVTVGVSDDLDWLPGDYIIVQWNWAVTSMTTNGVSIRAAFASAQGAAPTGGANSLKIDVKRVGASDYDVMRFVGAGASVKAADLSATLPPYVQQIIMGRCHEFEGLTDMSATVDSPADVTPRACLFIGQSSAHRDWSSGPYAPWSGALHATTATFGGAIDAYLTNIRIARARPVE